MSEKVVTQVAGNVWKVLVKPGDEVNEGDTLFILELMKTEVPHTAPRGGRIADVLVGEGDSVDAEQDAVVIE